MIEVALVMMAADLEAAKHRQESEKKWWAEFNAASPLMKSIMLKVRREMAAEEKIERRHRELVQAQKEIADAIRHANRPRYHTYF